MTGRVPYTHLAPDERHRRLQGEYAAGVRIRTDLTTPAGLLPRVTAWLDANVNAWAAASANDGTLDLMIYINTQRHAHLFALTWSEYVTG